MSDVFSHGLLSEPLHHMSFVFCHPFDVGLGLLYRLFQCQGGRAKTNMEVVFFKFLQLEEGDKKNKERKIKRLDFPSDTLRKIHCVFQWGCVASIPHATHTL